MSATLLYRIQGVRIYRYKKTNYQKDCVRIHFSIPKDRCVCPECGRALEFVGIEEVEVSRCKPLNTHNS